MGEIAELVKFSPLTLLFVVLIFGFLPGFILRLIVKAYPPDHPRRRELVAELYTIKRIERPFFVAEQLETAIFEGLLARKVAWRADKKLLNDLFDIPGLFLQGATLNTPHRKGEIIISGFEYRRWRLTRREVTFEADNYQMRAFFIEQVAVRSRLRRRMGMQQILRRTLCISHQPSGEWDEVGEVIRKIALDDMRRQARMRKRVDRLLGGWLADRSRPGGQREEA